MRKRDEGRERGANARASSEDMMPAFKKSFWRKLMTARTKTDTGGQGENPKVSERTVAKELGKIPVSSREGVLLRESRSEEAQATV